MKEEKKVSGKVLMFTGIVVIVFLVAVFGFIFWEPVPEVIQGEAEATEVRISGKVPGRIEKFLVNEGDRVKRGDTVAILDSPEVMAKYNQAQAAEEAAQALSNKAQKGAREEQKTMAFQTWKKAQAALDVAKKSYERVQKLYEGEVMSAQKRDEAEANYKAMLATEQAAKAQYEMARNGAEKEDKEAAEAQVSRAKGAVEEVSSYIKETFLISPIDGEISERYPKVGELVGTGSPVMNVLDLEDMWVVFNVREDLLGDLKMGTEFKGYIPALGNKEVSLKVTYLKNMGTYAAWRATKTTGQYDVKTFEVKAVPMEKVEGLRPGMSVLKKI
ncbi:MULTISPECIES: HlyD family secretion protein [Butyricimonas]|uniref:HlyD family secretion protein n=1 Tax=Butyricimonas TaxID=574697 RepID=UPI0007FB2C6B|nr:MULTISPECIES: HlyD family secretion protein [Butyricimonas]